MNYSCWTRGTEGGQVECQSIFLSHAYYQLVIHVRDARWTGAILAAIRL